MPTLSPGRARSSILAPPRARAWRGRLTESVRVTETEISAVPARTGLTAIRGLAGAQDADLCPDGSETRCWPPIPRTRTAGKPCGVRPGRADRGLHAFGPDRFNRNFWTRRGPILARTGSEPGSGPINCTRTLGEPFGHPPGSQVPRYPRLRPRVGLNRNLWARPGGERRSVPGRARSSTPARLPVNEFVEKPHGIHPCHGSRDSHGFGASRSCRARRGRSLPGRARSSMPAQFRAGKPFGIHPSHGSRDVQAFGPDRFYLQFEDQPGARKCRSLPGRARDPEAAPHPRRRTAGGTLRGPSEPRFPRMSTVSARAGLSVAGGPIGGAERRSLPGRARNWPPSVPGNGRGSLRSPSGSRIPRCPRFRADTVRP